MGSSAPIVVLSRPASLSPAEAFTRTAAALDRAALEVLVAPLDGPPTPVLGRYQRARSALASHERLGDALRRRTGGVCLELGAGQVYVSIVTPRFTTLFDATPRTILGRYVRPLLRGISLCGLPAHYFGRDWITASHRPVAWVGWEIAPSGAALFESVVSVRSPFLPKERGEGYPQRIRDPLREAQPTPLWDIGVLRGVEEVAERVTRGIVETLGVPTTPRDPASPDPAPAEAPEGPGPEPELDWSRPHEDAIGFVEAGLHVEDGRIVRARLAGDFYADSGGIAELERTLRGLAPDTKGLSQALDLVFQGGRHFLEGVRERKTLLQTFLAAADRARGITW